MTPARLPGAAIARTLLVVALSYATISAAPARADSLDARTLHVLNRVAFGPSPQDLAWVKESGVQKYLEAQLAPERIPESPDVAQRLAQLPTLRMDPIQLFQAYEAPRPPRGEKPDPEVVKAARERAKVVMEEAREARLIRAVSSPRQLEQVMVDFWFSHFNVFENKGLDRLWTGAYEEQAIRPYALGKFRDLLGATAHHGAMLFYLDNWESVGPGSEAARRSQQQGKEKGLNENYAREIMELHTLGVNGGYTQADVIALARILSGWTIHRGNEHGPGGRIEVTKTGFFFDPRMHDFGEKQFLGHTIRGQGWQEGEEALDILAYHPSTAKHIAFQLAQYFVADDPDPALVDQLAKRFMETKGDVRQVLRALFRSPQFWDPKNVRAKFKTPYEYVVSAVRATGAPVFNWKPLLGAMAQQGQPLYGCLTPDGWKNTRDAWLAPGAITERLGFATALGSGRMPLQATPGDAIVAAQMGQPMPKPQPLDPERLLAVVGLSPKTREAVAAADPKLQAAMIFGSPEFMQR
jgi:uncharacterized protein (DUF1800 family)